MNRNNIQGALICLSVLGLALLISYYGKQNNQDRKQLHPSVSTVITNRYSSVNANPHTNTYPDRRVINPYPPFSQQAFSLKYPPGIDTFAYWGNGRVSITGDTLYDEENDGANYIATNISVFHYTNCILYCKSGSRYIIYNMDAMKYIIYNNSREIESKYNKEALLLDDDNYKGNNYVKFPRRH